MRKSKVEREQKVTILNSSSILIVYVCLVCMWGYKEKCESQSGLRVECRLCTLPLGHNETPEGWKPRRNGRRLLPPPEHEKSDENGTTKSKRDMFTSVTVITINQRQIMAKDYESNINKYDSKS